MRRKLIKLATFFSFFLLLVGTTTSCGSSFDYEIEKVDNTGGSAWYEVFVHSFADSNGDGVGDFNGLKAKLPYLKDLGVGGIWLMPINSTDTYHGYDVKDYYNTNTNYGTLSDFSSLVDEAHHQGIKVIIDMVLNHSSYKNQWFLDSAKDFANRNYQEGSKIDWYNWSTIAKDGYQQYATAQYYEARFDKSMPDFNFDCQEVRDEFHDILSYWLDLGVDGFRFDAVKYFYYDNSTKTKEAIKEITDYCHSVKKDCYLVGESWVGTQSEINSYAKTGMYMFNFPTAENTSSDSAGSAVNRNNGYSFAYNLTYANDLLMNATSNTGNLVYFVSNHDQDRSAGYYVSKDDPVKYNKLLASAYLLTPGTPFMYYGEETGLKGSRGGASTDANRRLAMIWKDSYQCNDPVGSTYAGQITTSVSDELNDGGSLLNHYKKVLSIRNKYKDLFTYGTYVAEQQSDDAFAYLKITYGSQIYVLIHNFATSDKKLTLSLDNVSSYGILEEIKTSNSHASLSGSELTIPAFQSVLLGAIAQ